MSNIPDHTRWWALLLCGAVLTGCKGPATPPEDAPIPAASTAPSARELACARALQMATAGDPLTLELCDSLLGTRPTKEGGAEPYYYKGIFYATKGQPQLALQWFDKTIRADYTFLEAYIEKAALYLDLKRPDQALRELELLRTLSPGYAPAHYWLGKLNESQGQTDAARACYELAFSLDPSVTEARDALDRLKK